MLYFKEYIQHLIFLGLDRDEAIQVLEDVQPQIFWLEDRGDDVYAYLSDLVVDSTEYSEMITIQN